MTPQDIKVITSGPAEFVDYIQKFVHQLLMQSPIFVKDIRPARYPDEDEDEQRTFVCFTKVEVHAVHPDDRILRIEMWAEPGHGLGTGCSTKLAPICTVFEVSGTTQDPVVIRSITTSYTTTEVVLQYTEGMEIILHY